MSSGYSNYFVQDSPNSGFEKRVNAWVWVSDMAVVKSCYKKPNGPYIIRPDALHYKGAAFTGYCVDGWTLIMKIDRDSTFSFNSPYWTTDVLLNEDILDLAPSNAKFEGFNRAPFRRIKGCIGSSWTEAAQKCIIGDLGRTFDSAKSLFSGTYIRSNTNKDDWYNAFPVTGHRICDQIQQPGFNTQCRDLNSARWGMCHNIPGTHAAPLTLPARLAHRARPQSKRASRCRPTMRTPCSGSGSRARTAAPWAPATPTTLSATWPTPGRRRPSRRTSWSRCAMRRTRARSRTT